MLRGQLAKSHDPGVRGIFGARVMSGMGRSIASEKVPSRDGTDLLSKVFSRATIWNNI